MNQNSLLSFDFSDSPVRVVIKDGQPFFVVADVCRVLEIQNSRDAITGLDEDDVGIADVVDSAGRSNPRTNVVNESGLYSLIFTSRKEKARDFKRWVTKEVLPSIRKQGFYAMESGAEDELPAEPDAVFSLEEAAENSGEAARRLLEGTISVEAAQVVASLSGQVTRAWELRIRIKPLAMLPPSREAGKITQAICKMAASLEGDASFSIEELLEEAGLPASMEPRNVGLALRPYQNALMQDGSGRGFFLRKSRNRRGSVYTVQFTPKA